VSRDRANPMKDAMLQDALHAFQCRVRQSEVKAANIAVTVASTPVCVVGATKLTRVLRSRIAPYQGDWVPNLLGPPAMMHLRDEEPRSLRFADVRERRRALLEAAHMQPLTNHVRQLRARLGTEIPDFDPLDGGIDARVLFLFEKPGPMTSAASQTRAGSGFISRNNDDPSAEATHMFMRTAGLARTETISWNVIPGWNGTVKVTAAELREGAALIDEVVRMLPRLEAIVFVGRKAERARRYLDRLPVKFFSSAHPSPKVRSIMRAKWDAIPEQWSAVREFLNQSRTDPAS